jgi:cytochrome b subunit of formate dehydrogenase
MKLEKIVHWSLLIVIILYVVTGLGITQFRTVEALTFGLLGKNLSFVIHEYLLWPFIVLLVLHLLLTGNILKTK